MQMSLLQGRETLIHNGVPEALLPLTDELKLRLKEEESRLVNPDASTNAGG